ncbi:hypothetical protein ACQHIV_38845 [Kribbella sp. GL6]|uniref:hypothetical protein n=1 Tax=Kribbella sp. GL6 TaxID=3419765 RepID=UPI003D01B966
MTSDALFTRLAPVLNVSDLTAERAFYEKLGLPVIYEGPEYPDFIAFGTDTVHFGIQQAPAADWTYRRLLLRTPSGYRLALEGPTE